MTTYPRPAFDLFLGATRRTARPAYPYSRRLFAEHDVFEVFPLDGGAAFFTYQHLGDKSTRTFAEAFESGKLLGPWSRGRRGAPRAEELDWFGAYDPEKGPWAPGQKTEQHVWLHRLYFLLPLAQQYLRTGDRKWARRWFEFFIAWRRRFPAMGDPLSGKAKHTAYIWHDMQVAWRLLVLQHSVFMLGSRPTPVGGRRLAVGGKRHLPPTACCPFDFAHGPERAERVEGLLPTEWAEIYKAIAVHARWVHVEARDGLARLIAGGGVAGNHFLQKGTALIGAGTLFPELEGAADWVAVGRKVLSAHLRRDVNRDGGSVEACPSYSHFIAGLHLSAHLVLAANRKPPVPGIEQAVRRQYRFLEATMSPAGRALQVGDSYALDARRDLAVVRKLFPLAKADTKRSACLAASRFVVLRSATTQVYIDAMDVSCGHIHAPKPNVMIYHRGQPVAVDCGCVNYDLPEYKNHFRTWAAHNVVTPAAFLADPAAGRGIKMELARCKLAADGGEAEIVCRYSGKDARFVWRRLVKLAGDRVEVVDRLDSPRRETFTLFWHLAAGARPSVSVSGPRGQLTVKRGTQDAVDEDNRRVMAPTLSYRQSGRRVEFRTVIEIPD